MSARIDQAIELLEAELVAFEPSCVDGTRACALVEQYARIERLGAAGKLLALRQVAATGAWKKAGPFRDLHAWLASVSKSTYGHAHATAQAAQAAQRLAALAATEAAARSGELSSTQLETVTDAATADPNAEQDLLKTARTEAVRRLRQHAARVKAAACTDEVEREERIRAERSLRHCTDPDGAGRIAVRGPVTDIARIMAALKPFERAIFDAARNSELRERSEAYAFDALVAMANASRGTKSSTDTTKTGADYVGVIRIDHDAFVRGHTQPGELCELAGVGPIPVHEASRLLDDAFLKAVVVKGTEVTVVSHLGRVIPAHLRTAIEELYQECCIEGCHEQRHLEIDHNIPIEAGGRTELANLSRPCTFHHRSKHRHNLRLAGDGTHNHFVAVGGLPPPDGSDPHSPYLPRGEKLSTDADLTEVERDSTT
jgi:hypothetical protein